MRPLVIYHANCMDGAGAAFAAWLKFGDEAEYRPASYGDPAPTDEEVRGRDVYVLDFSYPRAELERIADAVELIPPGVVTHKGRLVVLDHHKTAQENCEGLDFCTFDMGMSGAALAWEHFHVPSGRHTYTLNPLFAYIQDRDLWRWDIPDSREISAALALTGAFSDFRKLASIYNSWFTSKDGLIRDGRVALKVQAQIVDSTVATAEEVLIEVPAHHPSTGQFSVGLNVRALAVTTPTLRSEIGEALAIEAAKRSFNAVGVVYYRDGKAGIWRVSLRSRDVYGGHPVHLINKATDVASIAEAFGGGGHARAASFECDELPWSRR